MNQVFAWLKSQKGDNNAGLLGTTAIKWSVILLPVILDQNQHQGGDSKLI